MDEQNWFFICSLVTLITCSQIFNSNKPQAFFFVFFVFGSHLSLRPLGLLGEGETEIDRERGKEDGKSCMRCLCVLAGRVPLRLYCKAIISGGVGDL